MVVLGIIWNYSIGFIFLLNLLLLISETYTRYFPGGSEVKVSAWNAGDPGLIPRLGRSPGEGNGYHSSILVWRIPWTEDPGGLQSMESQRVRHN